MLVKVGISNDNGTNTSDKMWDKSEIFRW